jgi:hypothetical protein
LCPSECSMSLCAGVSVSAHVHQQKWGAGSVCVCVCVCVCVGEREREREPCNLTVQRMQQVRQGGQRTASTIGAGVFFLPALPVAPCVWIPEAAWATKGSGAASADGCQEGSHRGHCTCAAGVEGHGEAPRTAHVGERCQMKCTAVILVSAGRSSTLLRQCAWQYRQGPRAAD